MSDRRIIVVVEDGAMLSASVESDSGGSIVSAAVAVARLMQHVHEKHGIPYEAMIEIAKEPPGPNKKKLPSGDSDWPESPRGSGE